MKRLAIFMLALSCLSATAAWSADDWYRQASGQLLLKGYNGSEQLDAYSGIAGFVSADYLERGGFTLGYHLNQTQYKSGLSAAPEDVDEHMLYLGGRLNHHPDRLPGRVSYRLAAYSGRDALHYDIVTGSSGSGMGGGGSSRSRYTVNDDIWALNPIVSFLNYAKTLYADLGYAYTRYHSSDNATDDIHIRQWTPTLGLGFNRAADWLQLRAYVISPSSSNRISNTDSTSAVEAKWTHWFGPEAPLALNNIRLTLLAGERRYALDSDARALSNVSDMQTDLLALAGEWRLGEQVRVYLQAGYESYKNRELNDAYNSSYLYAHISRHW